MWEFFTVNYMVDGDLKKQGEILYYTNGGVNTDEMKQKVKEVINQPKANISIILYTPISKEAFEVLTGKPFNK